MTAPESDSAAIRQIIRALLAAGYTLDGVHDGEEVVPVTNEKEAVEAITAVDVARLYLNDPKGGPLSHILFVLGNEPEEVAADYTVDLEPVLGPLTRSWW